MKVPGFSVWQRNHKAQMEYLARLFEMLFSVHSKSVVPSTSVVRVIHLLGDQLFQLLNSFFVPVVMALVVPMCE